MAFWIETYRGAASPWECDVTEHFTMAFYFDRIARAEAMLIGQLGLDAAFRTGLGRSYKVRLSSELRAGGAFHIESGLLAATPLRLGHRAVDSESGRVTTWFEAQWRGMDAPPPGDGFAAWNGPEFAERAEPTDLVGLIPSMAGRVQRGDLDGGCMGLAGMVHKFSDAAVQFGAAIGLTAEYIKTARRSFSAFELRLSIARFPGLGETYRIDSGLAHLGNTSLRYLHVMRDAGGAEIARVDRYGVQLDLDTRRPVPLAPALRKHAQRLLLSPT
jgi:acyl-CoA thioesterase FadM